MDPAQWLAGYDDHLARAAAGAKAAGASLRQVGGTAVSPRGEVTVTVGPGGTLEDLRLTAAARALEVDRLAQLVLATTRRAQQAAVARVAEIMTEYVGEGPALELVTQRQPVRPVVDNDYETNPPEIFP